MIFSELLSIASSTNRYLSATGGSTEIHTIDTKRMRQKKLGKRRSLVLLYFCLLANVKAPSVCSTAETSAKISLHTLVYIVMSGMSSDNFAIVSEVLLTLGTFTMTVPISILN